MFNQHPKHSGIYRIKDNIKKLELEVHLQHVNTLLKLPPLRNSSASSSVRSSTEDPPIIARIKWQQKILSSQEAELYKDLTNCLTDTQKLYHKWLKAREEDMAHGRSKGRNRRKSSKKLPLLEDSTITLGQQIFTYISKDFHQPAEEQMPRREGDSQDGQETMYVYAALEPDTLLVSLRWHPERQMLQIYPDFNVLADHPYFVEIDTDYRHLYAYAVVNVSPKRPLNGLDGQIADFLQMPELLNPLSPQMALTERSFSMPPKRMTRVSMLLELRSAKGFDVTPSHQLHVRYHMHLPEGLLLEEGLMHASTQSASGYPAIQYGYTWQVTVTCEEHFRPTHPMHIFFEVISVDTWARERLEGYAHYTAFLLRPSHEAVTLECLRPRDDFMERLRRFFVGGRKKYDFMSFLAGPSLRASGAAPKGAFQCRYGERWQSSGQLEFHCQRMTQSNRELWMPPPSSGGSSYGMCMDDIRMAYQEARKRLEAIVF